MENNLKPYELGLILGRFQTFHLGHEQIVRRALDVSKQVLLLIGSSQESNTAKNPFSYEIRKDIIYSIFKDEVDNNRLIIKPLPDAGLGNNSKWGAYVIEKCQKLVGRIPDLMVSGKEERRTSWFDDELHIDEIFVSKVIDISASRLREFIINDDFDSWKNYVNDKLWNKFEMMKNIINESKDNENTMSI